MAKKPNAVEWVRAIRDQRYEETKDMTPQQFADHEEARLRPIEEQRLWKGAVDERLFAEDDAKGAPGALSACSGDERLQRRRAMSQRLEREMQGLSPEERQARIKTLSQRNDKRLGRRPLGRTPEEWQALKRSWARTQATMLALRAREEAAPASSAGSAGR